MNAKGVRLGNDYYFGPVSMAPQNKTGREKKYEEEEIEKDNLIKLLMEAKIKVSDNERTSVLALEVQLLPPTSLTIYRK